MRTVLSKTAGVVLRLLRITLAAVLAPVAVLFFAVAAATRRHRLRSRALEPGTVTEVMFESALIDEMEPKFGSYGSEGFIRLLLSGEFRSTRIGPSGVAVEDLESLEFWLPLDPGLMIMLSTLQGQRQRVRGDLRLFAAPHAEFRSTDTLERARLSPVAGGPVILFGGDDMELDED